MGIEPALDDAGLELDGLKFVYMSNNELNALF
jgi:hypothetical protein